MLQGMYKTQKEEGIINKGVQLEIIILFREVEEIAILGFQLEIYKGIIAIRTMEVIQRNK